ncbi:MAG TPA: hypothetical protein VKB88_23660 [Bryobacteraceae bacterium]|nr:hypothetical protein [Bryobacteraceae bacterium]
MHSTGKHHFDDSLRAGNQPVRASGFIRHAGNQTWNISTHQVAEPEGNHGGFDQSANSPAVTMLVVMGNTSKPYQLREPGVQK